MWFSQQKQISYRSGGWTYKMRPSAGQGGVRASLSYRQCCLAVSSSGSRAEAPVFPHQNPDPNTMTRNLVGPQSLTSKHHVVGLRASTWTGGVVSFHPMTCEFQSSWVHARISGTAPACWGAAPRSSAMAMEGESCSLYHLHSSIEASGLPRALACLPLSPQMASLPLRGDSR